VANVLFVCLHNAGRSQMSQALFEREVARRRADRSGEAAPAEPARREARSAGTGPASVSHQARSAGTTPGDRVHPEVVEVMDELGLDLSDRVPQALTQEMAEWADVVVTMGCGDECPYVPGRRYLDWDLPDPKGRPLDDVRATRDEIADRVAALVAELDG